jgi:hypothetical protein
MALVRFDRSLALASVAALALVCGLAVSRPARALDDDGKQNVFSSILGMVDFQKMQQMVGRQPQDDGPEIDYRERPTLVVPPKMDLPAPVAPGARRSAEWPNDPDVLRRKKKAEEAEAPIASIGNNDLTRPLTKDELLAHRGTSAVPADQSGDFARCAHGQCDWMRPEVLKQEGAAEEKAKGDPDNPASDIVTAGVEPPRKYLTEPPSGYRKATATVKAPPSQPAVIQENTEHATSFWQNMNPFKSDDDE